MNMDGSGKVTYKAEATATSGRGRIDGGKKIEREKSRLVFRGLTLRHLGCGVDGREGQKTRTRKKTPWDGYREGNRDIRHSTKYKMRPIGRMQLQRVRMHCMIRNFSCCAGGDDRRLASSAPDFLSTILACSAWALGLGRTRYPN